MLGAIVGDIAGSRFEWHNIKTKDFDFLTHKCHFTDDSVMSLAVAKAIMQCNDYTNLGNDAVCCMQNLGRKYPNAGYGGHFHRWIYDAAPQPYNSWGNGSAMRVSACGFAATSLEEAILKMIYAMQNTRNASSHIDASALILRTSLILQSRGRYKANAAISIFPIPSFFIKLRTTL